ncbi:hypothetical protein CJ260_11320 [Megasphaera sp. ASD88]|uniref:hypothetical protein n=1 Tax=Megasphaera sp. ASD88 TaxID=2027407 RepID=UPI000BAB31DD|nr:hypothetical protein [Megasphaera sp. ASD88]PAV38032.1 hypothetical protein CJ260_11320 [Megasphaera sp. ASD88]
MKWHKATKVLPPLDEAVLVKNPCIDNDYKMCKLEVFDKDNLIFQVLDYDSKDSYFDIQEGTLWARITLPE